MIADASTLDLDDPLAHYRTRFLPAGDVVSYLDGNSLGRPLTATAERFGRFLEQDWGSRLIRSWDEQWFDLPLSIGDRIGALTLGAEPGQTVVADSTTVMLYKLVRAALDSRPGRTEIVVDDDNFPTDRFVLEGIARERGMTLRWSEVDRARGITSTQIRDTVTENTALVVVSHVAYRSGYLADMASITEIAHASGALVLWDLCHSAGVVPIELDAWQVDLAVGCTYKYLNGGPGSPAFGYVAARLQVELEQPIWGWMGAADVFGMRDRYQPAEGMRRFISGTPPVIGMLALQDMLDLIEEAGIEAIRDKSLRLTDYARSLVEEWLVPLGATIATPHERERRGSHLTVTHPSFRVVTEALWAGGVIPDFRNPDGIRIGLSPLSTSFDEVRVGIAAVRDAMKPGPS
jgi:kynureninase